MDQFDIELAQASEQGSQMWVDIRAGRFTSSENWKLMESGTREMNAAELAARPKTGKGSKSKYIEDPSCLSETTETYIRTKVAETLTGQASHEFWSHATAWGDEYEPIAAEHYANKFQCEYEILSFVPFGDHAGGESLFHVVAFLIASSSAFKQVISLYLVFDSPFLRLSNAIIQASNSSGDAAAIFALFSANG